MAENESVCSVTAVTGGRAVRGDGCATANLENRATMAPEVRDTPPVARAAVIESPHAQRSDDYPTSRRARQRTAVSRGVYIVRSVTGYRGRVSGLFDFPSNRVFGTGGASSEENRRDQYAHMMASLS